MTNQTNGDLRDPELPDRLLTTERDELIPLLRSLPKDAFALRTCLPGWTVRHVVAHCAAVLRRGIEGRMSGDAFTPEGNDRDIAEQAHLSVGELVDALERGMTEAGPVIKAAGGSLDRLAFAEWVHTGDIRDALGESGAYGGGRLESALGLLVPASRGANGPRLDAVLEGGATLSLGAGEGPVATYRGDGSTLIRLYAGRPLTGTRYDLVGAKEADLVMFG